MIDAPSFEERLGPELAGALVNKGFSQLTPVQEAVLDAGPGVDLRISSQTGSGKTVALGLAVRDLVEGVFAQRPERGIARPRVLAQLIDEYIDEGNIRAELMTGWHDHLEQGVQAVKL